MANAATTEAVHIELGPVALDGDLDVPAQTAGLVIFAHRSSSSRFSCRNRAVAKGVRRSRSRVPKPACSRTGAPLPETLDGIAPGELPST